MVEVHMLYYVFFRYLGVDVDVDVGADMDACAGVTVINGTLFLNLTICYQSLSSRILKSTIL
jgi:hypothetical protein